MANSEQLLSAWREFKATFQQDAQGIHLQVAVEMGLVASICLQKKEEVPKDSVKNTRRNETVLVEQWATQREAEQEAQTCSGSHSKAAFSAGCTTVIS